MVEILLVDWPFADLKSDDLFGTTAQLDPFPDGADGRATTYTPQTQLSEQRGPTATLRSSRGPGSSRTPPAWRKPGVHLAV